MSTPDQTADRPRRYVAFDLETAKEVPEDRRYLPKHRPLGIACAATLAADAEGPTLWHGKDSQNQPAEQMSQADAARLVGELMQLTEAGYTILTWNGLGFDFDILAEESGEYTKCEALALQHVDMMFHAFCELGHPIGLDPAAKAMKLTGKTPGMNGLEAPRMWAEGQREQVLDYVAQDVRMALELAQTCEAHGRLRWITRKGKTRAMSLPQGWFDVTAALKLSEPDTSWMSNPWPRSKFTGWLPSNAQNRG